MSLMSSGNRDSAPDHGKVKQRGALALMGVTADLTEQDGDVISILVGGNFAGVGGRYCVG